MVALALLLLEASLNSHISTQIQYPSPISTTPSIPPITPPRSHREEPLFSRLWKGICRLFNGIFKNSQKTSWEQQAREAEAENMALKERLAERAERLERLKNLTGDKLHRGTRRVSDVLKTHVERTHVERMRNIEGLALLFQRHEIAISECLLYKQGYETITGKYNDLAEQYRSVIEETEELAEHGEAFRNAYLREREKVAVYEQAWSELISASSSS